MRHENRKTTFSFHLSAFILIILVSCGDDEVPPPTSPAAVSATAGEGQVIISWNDVEGALSYNIYWSESTGVTTPNGTLISNAVSPYSHTGLSFGATYYYIMTAENDTGESSASGEVSATIRPLTPENVSVSPGEGDVTISWDNVSGATSYNIYWAETTGVTSTNGTLISNTSSPYTHTGLTLGATYYYIVAASNEGGESDPSSEVNASIRGSSGTVKYKVTSSPAGFDITYENSTGNTEQRDISTGSWTLSFTGNSGDFVYISAQADNENTTITAKILYKGKVIEEATSIGDYVIATASGSLP